jgi:hypothetical protein
MEKDGLHRSTMLQSDKENNGAAIMTGNLTHHPLKQGFQVCLEEKAQLTVQVRLS